MYDTLSQAQQRIDELEATVCAMRRRVDETTLLNRVITAVAAAHDLTAAFEVACAELARAFSVPQSALAVLDPTRSFLTVIAEFCAPGRTSVIGEHIPVANNPITEYILEHRVPMVVEDVQRDPRLAVLRDIFRIRETASLLIAPVMIQDELVGTVGIDAIEPRVFSEADVALAQQVCYAISPALHNAQLYAAMQQELAERERAESIIREQASTLLALSTPLIPLSNKVLVAPLIGAVDSRRAQHIMETILTGVSTHQASMVIIDITGLSCIDTQIASILVQAARAVKLLGAATSITGIRPEVAQTLVGMGASLGDIRTFGTLQSGVKEAIRAQQW